MRAFLSNVQPDTGESIPTASLVRLAEREARAILQANGEDSTTGEHITLTQYRDAAIPDGCIGGRAYLALRESLTRFVED